MGFEHAGCYDRFNIHRLLEPTGNIPPAETEERYYAMLQAPAMAAYLRRSGLRQTRGGSVVNRAESGVALR